MTACLSDSGGLGGGDQEWAVLELEANGVCKNGTSPSPQQQPQLSNRVVLLEASDDELDKRNRDGLSTAIRLVTALQ